MYAPEPFTLTDGAAIRAAMAAHPLAQLATNGPDGPLVTPLPLVARDEAEGLVLYGHFARANPHWQALGEGVPSVAIFTGAQGYVSPGWYATKRETGKVVPTWNYVTVQARGVPLLCEPGAPTREAVEMLTDAMEAARPEPWQVADAPARFTEVMLRGIVAFRMVVTQLDAKAKLSQNRPESDVAGTRDGLAADGHAALSNAVADASPYR